MRGVVRRMGRSREALLADAVMVDKMEPPAPRDWWRGAVLYEIYWRSFFDTNGDGVGDLKGVEAKLDYVASLGVDAIWIAPFYTSPGEDFGYDVADLRNVDKLAGTMSDFLDVLAAAHERKLRVLIDFIPVHTSDEHAWFKESRSSRDNERADWYVWADAAADGTPPNNWLSSFGGSAWTWDPRRSQYYYHPFLTCQPALNLANPEVLEAVLADMRFWLDLGVDGFRLDAVQCMACDTDMRDNPPAPSEGSPILLGGGPNNPFRKQSHMFDRDVPEAFPIIERIRQMVDEYDGDRILVGELADVDSSRAAEKYTADGRRYHAIYDFDLINCAGEDMPRIINMRDDHLRTGWVYNVFTNHDSKRAVSNMAGSARTRDMQMRAAKMLLFMQFTLKGGGAIYQGDELGLPHPKLKREDLRDPWGINLWPDFEGRDGARTPMPWRSDDSKGGFTEARKPWLPTPREHLPLAVEAQEKDPASVLAFTRELLKWRKSQPLIMWGGEVVVEAPDQFVVFERFVKRDRIRIVVNISPKPRLYLNEAPCQLVKAPGVEAELTEHGIEMPPFGFAVCRDKR